MLDRAHLFTSFSPTLKVTVLASALALAALTGACTKSESGASGTATTGTAAPTGVAPSASAASKDSTPDAAPAEATANAAADAATTAVAASASAGTKTTASAAASASAAPAAAECGTKPLPDCPLQGWMKANMNPAVAAQDFPALATALDKAATFAPAGYTNWASIAKDGAKAARAQDLTAAKASCRTCHDQYKDKFKKDTAVRAKKI